MAKLFKKSAFPKRVASRFTRSSGSVLILVIALLVLLALLGTAYISTTRVDRFASKQHTTNVEIDMLVEGVVNQVASAIQSDIYDASGTYRPPDTFTLHNSNYDNYDAYGFTTPYDVRGQGQIAGLSTTVAHDAFLAQRFPWTLNPTAPFGAANPPVWLGLSYPVQQGTSTTTFGSQWQFSSPDGVVVPSGPPTLDLSLPYGPNYASNVASATVPPNFTAKPWFVPTVKEFPTGSGKFYPALTAYGWTPIGAPPSQLQGPTFIAADADGDGVADSGLCKLPVGTIDGVTYYAAIRVIDNNSALNVNTAWSNVEFDGSGAPTINAAVPYPGRFYTPASIGLAELLRTTNLTATSYANKGNEFRAIEQYWLQGNSSVPGVQNGPGTPRDDSNPSNAILRFQYQSLQDAIAQLLSVRASNPGNTGNANTLARGFSITDSMALAYHFGLINTDSSASALESVFANADVNDSIYHAAPNYGKMWNAYAVSGTGITNWYQNLDFANEVANTPTSFLPRRSMLVATNPVSCQAPAHTIDNYALIDGIPPYVPAGLPAPVPVASLTKTSINQAPFSELWRAFWNVMAENVTIPAWAVNAGTVYRGSPFDLRILATAASPASSTLIRVGTSPALDPPTFNDPYLGTTFGEYNETTPAGSYAPTNSNSYDPTKSVNANPPAMPAPTDYHPARMFRSPMRAIPDPTVVGATPGFNAATPRLDAHQTMVLRAAIAAANVQDLRDSDDNITAQRIVLQPTNGGTSGTGSPGVIAPAEAIVYGTERQPYITEIYVETDTEYGPKATPNALINNPYGYVAIELYNPYSEDIALTNWKIAAIDRRSQPMTSGVKPPYSSDSNTLIRTGATAPGTPYNLVLDQSALIADFDPAIASDVLVGGTTPVTAAAPLIVPAGGYLLLENYYDPTTYPNADGPVATLPSTGFAGHRPTVTGLPPINAIPGANAGNDRSTPTLANPVPAIQNPLRPAGMPRLNVACVPGLSGMSDANWNTTEWPVPVRSVINREMVLLRPRRADGNYSYGIYPAITTPTSTYPAQPYDERPNLTTPVPPFPGVAPGEVAYSHLRDLVPVDSFDFSGLLLPQPDGDGIVEGVPAPPEPLGRANTPTTVANLNTAVAWHYVRQNIDPSTAAVTALRPPNWKFVYPGRYNAQPLLVTAANAGSPTGDPLPRQQGTQYTAWPNQNSTGNGNIWTGSTTTPVPALKAPATWFTFGTDITGVNPVSNDNTMASYPTTFRVPLAFNNYLRGTITGLPPTLEIGRNTIGEKPLDFSGANNIYPFGGFARDGDILATPFIGAYTIRYLYPPANATQLGSTFTIAEMNSVTMDSVFAEDTDIHDDPDPTDETTPNNGAVEREQLGRFCPVRVLLNSSGTTTVTTPFGTPDYNGYPTPSFTNYTSPGIAVNDYGFDPSYQPANFTPGAPARGCDWEPFWRYHWAADLFDYLSVRTPSDDYLPNYPMQREWRGLDNSVAASVSQEYYYQGDVVSFYNPNSSFAGNGPAHEIWVCRISGPVTGISPAASGSQFVNAFASRPVKNTSDPGVFSGDLNPGSASFRIDRSLVITPAQQIQAYYDAHREDNVAVEGLININTADWKVLSTLPLIVNPASGLPDDGTTPYPAPYDTYRKLNQQMAMAIEYYRDVDGNEDPNIVQPHGPFRSIFELNRVVDLRPGHPLITTGGMGYPAAMLPGFQNGYGLMPIPNTAPVEPDDSLGDLTPVGVATSSTDYAHLDGVRGDYEERNLELTRISNLITMHSDSFTAYILVQGWRDAETPNAQLVVQRRVGYIMDRSRITPQTPDKFVKQAFVNN